MSFLLVVLIATIQATCALDCRNSGSFENDISELLYELPRAGTLSSVTWSNKKLSPSDQRILYHDASTNTTNFYNGYDGRAAYVEGSDIVGLRIAGTTQSDIAEYEIRVSKSGVHLGLYNLTHIVSSEDLDKLEVGACTGTGFKLKREGGSPDISQKIRPCATFNLTMPDGYSKPFNVHFTQDGHVSVLNHTQCQKDPCVLEMNSKKSAKTVRIEVDFLFCLVTKNPAIEFTIASYTDPIRYIVAEIVFAIIKLVVIIPVCECVILKAKGSVGTRRRNMWLLVGLGGVLVDVIVAAVVIGVFHDNSNRDPDDVPYVLGVNLGLALGASAVLLLYAGIKHKSVNEFGVIDQREQDPEKHHLESIPTPV